MNEIAINRIAGAMIMILMTLTGMACGTSNTPPVAIPDAASDLKLPIDSGPQTAVLAGGCFWCTEAVFEQIEGVSEVVSGYAGGKEQTANYQAVSSGSTQHAEVIRITYDPLRVRYGQLLKIFFSVAHDPTQLDRQGPDTGPQYRSTIFFANAEEKRVAQAYIDQLDQAKVFDRPIATTLEPLDQFYVAEEVHQDFVRLNPSHPYVRQQALPKVEKVKKHFTKTTKP